MASSKITSTDPEEWTLAFLHAAGLENAGPDFVATTVAWFGAAIATAQELERTSVPKPPAANAPAHEFLDYMGVDAQKWAQQFINTFRGEVVSDNGHNANVDVGLMIGWFANAIAAGEHRVLARSMSVLAPQANDTAHKKGWWDKGRELDGVLMLIVSEAAEALEEWRNNREPDETYFSIPDYRPDLTEFKDQNLRDRMYHLEGSTLRKNISVSRLSEDFSEEEVDLLITKGYLKPEGIPSEFADIIIRVFDAAVEYDIDIEDQVRMKMAYNATRAHRHGGKRS